jgi:hypothetical protein
MIDNRNFIIGFLVALIMVLIFMPMISRADPASEPVKNAIFYEGDNFTGNNIFLGGGTDAAKLPSLSTVKSIILPAGLAIQMYSDENFKGFTLTFIALNGDMKINLKDNSYVVKGEDWSGRVKSFHVIDIANPTNLIVFSGTNFTGNMFQVKPGKYNTMQKAGIIGQIGSIIIPANSTVRVYSKGTMKGDRNTWITVVPLRVDLATVKMYVDSKYTYTWNNSVRSLDFETRKTVQTVQNSAVSVYNVCNYKGDSKQVNGGSSVSDLTSIGLSSGGVRSLKIPRNLSVTLYSDKDFTGENIVFIPPATEDLNIDCLSKYQMSRGTWDNNVVSMKVNNLLR